MRKLLRLVTMTMTAGLALGACGHKNKSKSDAEAQPSDETPNDGLESDQPLRQESEADMERNDAVASFRGFLSVNDILSQRLMAEGRRFYLGTYLDSYYRDEISGLPQLLGYDAGTGLRSEFRNGQANAINMVLWHMTLSSVAHDVAVHCAAEDAPTATAVSLNPRFLEALRPVCAWPSPAARDTAALRGLWQVVMAYDAPRTEFDAFRAFFQGPDYDAATGEEAVQAMMTAMLYNPHFLVRK